MAVLPYLLGWIKAVRVSFAFSPARLSCEIRFFRAGPQIELLRFLLLYLCRLHRYVVALPEGCEIVPTIGYSCLDRSKSSLAAKHFRQYEGLLLVEERPSHSLVSWSATFFAKRQARVCYVAFPEIHSEVLEASAFLFTRIVAQRLENNLADAQLAYKCLSRLLEEYTSGQHDLTDLRTAAVLPQKVYFQSLLTSNHDS